MGDIKRGDSRFDMILNILCLWLFSFSCKEEGFTPSDELDSRWYGCTARYAALLAELVMSVSLPILKSIKAKGFDLHAKNAVLNAVPVAV